MRLASAPQGLRPRAGSGDDCASGCDNRDNEKRARQRPSPYKRQGPRPIARRLLSRRCFGSKSHEVRTRSPSGRLRRRSPDFTSSASRSCPVGGRPADPDATRTIVSERRCRNLTGPLDYHRRDRPARTAAMGMDLTFDPDAVRVAEHAGWAAGFSIRCNLARASRGARRCGCRSGVGRVCGRWMWAGTGVVTAPLPRRGCDGRRFSQPCSPRRGGLPAASFDEGDAEAFLSRARLMRSSPGIHHLPGRAGITEALRVLRPAGGSR